MKIVRESYGFLKTENTQYLKENYEPGGYLVIRTIMLWTGKEHKLEYKVVALL